MTSGKWHKVKQGDSLEAIAIKNGHYWQTLWEHSENQHLKEECSSAHALNPGQQVYIPPIQTKEVTIQTGRRHCFKRKGIPSRFRMRFVIDGEPRANETYVIFVDEEERSGTTDGDGVLDEPVPVEVRHIRVEFEAHQRNEAKQEESSDESSNNRSKNNPKKDVYEFKPRHLDSSKSTTGVQARLRALGFDAGKIDGELGPRSRDALMSYQEAAGLEVTGILDDATIASLSKEIPG